MTAYQTQYGTVYDGGVCKDDYPNINIYHQTDQRLVKLQGPALRAFRGAEARVATRRKKHLLITGIGWRSCSLQRELWMSDSNRFANPDGSKHCRGLAIDVDQGQGTLRLRTIHRALIAEGWHQSVPGEPWHYSFFVSG